MTMKTTIKRTPRALIVLGLIAAIGGIQACASNPAPIEQSATAPAASGDVNTRETATRYCRRPGFLGKSLPRKKCH